MGLIAACLGVGLIIAGALIGYSSDVRRFRNRDYAAYDGTAPVEFSSGGRTVHRLCERGNRQLNHAIYTWRPLANCATPLRGRAYFERKLTEGKTKKKAVRALKRQISNVAYRQLVADARRAGR